MTTYLRILLIFARTIKAKVRHFSNEIEIERLKALGVLEIGKFSYGFLNIKYWDKQTRLIIGNFVSIADGVTFLLGGNHRIDWVSTFPFPIAFKKNDSLKKIIGHPSTKGDICVGHDVWIGQNATILSGVAIGNGAVIGAECVVTNDVPSYAILVGNPGRIVGYRFDETTILKLNEIQWWNWSDGKIENKAKLLSSVVTNAILSELETD
jgi:acetyltransferase-like isoleucine patch superfamily enzyme